LQGRTTLAVAPLDLASIRIAEMLTSSLAETLGLDAGVERIEEAVPQKAFNPSRGQYDASRLVSSHEANKAGLLLLVTDLDLYVNGLNFCFGLAHRRTAIISLHRLRPEFYRKPSDESLLVHRAEKEAVHEVCHLMGLRHCGNPLCVMHFSNWIGDTDIKKKWPCKACMRKIRAATI